MNIPAHDDSIRYLISFADEMILDSKNDQQHRKLLLNLAENFLMKLINFYENEKSYCFQGYIYQKLGWVKYYTQDYLSAEKFFLYSIVNLKNCRICRNELLESYWGVINTYIYLKKFNVAKKYFLTYYRLQTQYPTISVEQDFDYLIQILNISAEDLLKK